MTCPRLITPFPAGPVVRTPGDQMGSQLDSGELHRVPLTLVWSQLSTAFGHHQPVVANVKRELRGHAVGPNPATPTLSGLADPTPLWLTVLAARVAREVSTRTRTRAAHAQRALDARATAVTTITTQALRLPCGPAAPAVGRTWPTLVTLQLTPQRPPQGSSHPGLIPPLTFPATRRVSWPMPCPSPCTGAGVCGGHACPSRSWKPQLPSLPFSGLASLS